MASGATASPFYDRTFGEKVPSTHVGLVLTPDHASLLDAAPSRSYGSRAPSLTVRLPRSGVGGRRTGRCEGLIACSLAVKLVKGYPDLPGQRLTIWA